jgi:hypothetical protein
VGFQGYVGPSDLAAGQTITLSNPPVYKPTAAGTGSGAARTPGLELNSGYPQAAEGDMVAGTYGQNPSYQPDAADTDGSHDENATYTRRDFQPATSSSSPPPAFVARMRRTSNPNNIDNEPGISSGGAVYPNGDPNSTAPATLPYLFGRGSLMSRTAAAQGVTVRATAIAAAGPVAGLSQNAYTAGLAKTIGTPYAPANVAGALCAQLTTTQLVYIVLNLSKWESFTPGTTVRARVTSAGLLQSIPPNAITVPITYGYLADGSAVDPADVSAVYPNGRPYLGPSAMIGDQANPYLGASPAEITNAVLAELPTNATNAIAYLPIVDDGGPSSPLSGRVVGFGYVYGVGCPVPGELVLTKGTNTIAAQNGSGVLGVPLPIWFSDPTHGATRTQQLFSEHEGYSDFLSAPVLVDRYIGPN